MTPDVDPFEITHASESAVWTADGRRHLDLTIGFGAVFLGHLHPGVSLRLQDQLSKLWLCGRAPTRTVAQAEKLIRALLPVGFKPAGLYSTGMEVAEFAMRLAAHHSGRREFAGFSRSMHGKSGLTASMCWENAPVNCAGVHILPFIDQLPEDEVLSRLAAQLKPGRTAALFVEPIQGSNGGHEASLDFYRAVIALCRETGTYCVFDEILTGLYRTGSVFYADRLAVKPDFLLFAKSMANGFPVSSLAIPESMEITPQCLPGSTFSGNPLAAAAVAGTLEAMAQIPMASRVAAIESTVRGVFDGHGADLFVLRGRGALWVLEAGPRVQVAQAIAAIRDSGVMVSSQGGRIRLLPAATIDLTTLREACVGIVAALDCAYA